MSADSARQPSETTGAATTAPETPFTSALARVAPGIFVLLWATGFLIAKLGVPYAQPMTILAMRFVLAAIMMASVAMLMRAPWPRSWKRISHIAVIGILLHAVYLGGCYLAIYGGMPAGMAALIVGFQPILTATLAGPVLGERTRSLQWIGIVVGFVGLMMVLWERMVIDLSHPAALLFAVLSLLGITSATIYQKRFCPSFDLRSGSAIQYIAASLVTVPVSLLFGIGDIDWAPTFIFALAWLVIVLSGVSIALLTWMISRGAASKVASLFYLTPPIAAIGSYFWFGETLSALALAGMAVIVFGLYLLNRTRPV
ncbi:DMT family transporter [Dongia deserti]|uniref:DMT family transporter n=1 Tax=Dongia deserti TaxID=2268030 RepID=UPI000E64678C|nr:DMT family transporter [Dongia deserti]